MKKILHLFFSDPMHLPVLLSGANILASKGCNICVLGVHNIKDKEERIKSNTHENITIKMLPYCKKGLQQKMQFAAYNLWVLIHLVFWRPDVIYANDKMVCPIALLIKLFSNRRLIYHEHFCNNGEENIRPQFLVKYRRKLARVCDLCVLPNKPRLDQFIREVGDYGQAIYAHNYPFSEEFMNIPMRSRSKSKQRLKIFFFGHLGPGKLPLELFYAMEQLKDKVELFISGIDGSGGFTYEPTIRAEINKRGLQENVHYIGFIKERAELLKQCAQADIGLCVVQKEENEYGAAEFGMEGASQRTFEIMGVGLVPLVSDLREWEEFFVKDGYGYSCDPDDAENIEEVLTYLHANKHDLYDQGMRNREKIFKEWNYKTEFNKIEQFIGV